MCSPPSVNKESLFLKSILEVSFFLWEEKVNLRKKSNYRPLMII